MRAISPRGHWWVLAAVLTVFLSALFLATSILRGAAAPATTRAQQPDGLVPHSVSGGGPVVDARGGPPVSLDVRPGTVALTFDDGPDPAWTPQILRLLAAKEVPATFFVVGQHVAEHPELVRAEIAAGHEVGLHTFTHADLATAPVWQLQLELAASRAALAGATGISTTLLRPPYSSLPDAVDDRDWHATLRTGALGYLTVLSTHDGLDWEAHDPEDIVRGAAPQDGRGAVVLLHDGGGDRSRTVAALGRLIDDLKANGYRFTTLTESVGLPPQSTPVTSFDRWYGTALIGLIRAAGAVPPAAAALLYAVALLTAVRLLLLAAAAMAHRRRTATRPVPQPLLLPGVSVVVPAHNEAATIVSCVRALLEGGCPDIDVVVVDDGSTDATAAAARTVTDPRVRVVTQSNQGKPAALNAGVALAEHDVILMVDADTVLAPGAVAHLAAAMADPSVGAVAGNTKVANRTGLLPLWQHLEYVMSFGLERRLFDLAGASPTVPGAIGAFRRRALASCGGISADTLAEDTDIAMALCRAGWRVVYRSDAHAHTHVPTTIRELWHQRYRWAYGTLQSIWKHRRAVKETGTAGHLGRRTLPYLLLFQLALPLAAPLMDAAALYGLISGTTPVPAITWAAFSLAQLALAAYALRSDGESLRHLWLIPLQQTLYRTALCLVTIHALTAAALGAGPRWHNPSTAHTDRRAQPAAA
ncbi:bifunctional polysaccharide deacetylase/glycosyltransferase family 2 protein [Streptomyces sp. TBY4]|uniref:bifunctional polysaccharide deacetylase/glycosyltransferase family 2 protein n=1 Tax=Streptomyces sp. TBY4 TaxID=2962030 RepID=UPI0020B861E4|nr:bifunctional polysaccharide deacetylase/glycosyltransferase family 2 protein [Streptomyces sp. TBY4]MCP3759371.1 bifunctional polysaccharide deacetylase/glycosyltransferase family 2 protein [Streptomyces sp. TBY4]